MPDETTITILIIVLLVVGFVIGRGWARDEVRRELQRHLGPSARSLRDLPAPELAGIIHFAITGQRPTGW